MENLIELYGGKEPRVKTWDLWKGFGYSEHRALKKIIWDNKDDFEEFGKMPSVISSSVVDGNKKKGRPDESYFLNEDQFMLLVTMVKNTPESKKIKMSLVKEFKRMKNALASLATQKSTIDYHTARQNGKQVYFQKTDVIKKFVEYAAAQGSQSANLYYTNIAKMENSALFLVEQIYPNLREAMNVRQLMQVATADQIVEKALQDGMNDSLHYKDIYKLAKDRVIQFSEIIGKSQVIALLEKTGQLDLLK
jgi:phage regulator Rha-like protein